MASSVFIWPGFLQFNGSSVAIGPNAELTVSTTAVTSTVPLAVTGEVRAFSGGFNAADASLIYWNSLTLMSAPANGQLNFTTNNAGAGIGLDLATDAVLKIRTRAQSAYATMDALGYRASGAAGVSFGPSAVTSITVVNGIVTAIS